MSNRGLLFLCATSVAFSCASPPAPLWTGLEVLVDRDFTLLVGKKVGVVAHAASVDRKLRGLVDLLGALPGIQLAAIFGPEHGASGAAQAGEKVAAARDPSLGVPVHSLYGETRRPTPEMLAGLEVILFDLQDVGCRAYTYLSTLVEVLTAAAAADVEVWVLDRPNPLGGSALDGPLLEPGRESFVGAHTVPLRHGLTAGEFALMVNRERALGARLRVVAMEGWSRDRSSLDFTGLPGRPWVPPSPNIPTLESSYIYAGFVLVEGTNLSEGRGTTLPFQFLGAPWLDGPRLAHELNGLALPGCRFRSVAFTPSASKHQGVLCHGVQTHVTDPRTFEPVRTAVAVLGAARRQRPEEFRFLEETFDRLAGTSQLRAAIEAGETAEVIARSWTEGLEAFRRRRAPFLLYR